MEATSDHDAPLEGRARAWLHANCAHCHRDGGEMGYRAWGPWYVPLGQTDLCRVIVPGDTDSSPILSRALDAASPMPPIASLSPDPLGVTLLAAWIEGMTSCSLEAP